MADPFTLAVVAATASGGLKAFQAFRDTRAANAQAEADASTAQMNADIMNQNSALEARRQQRELSESRRKFNLTQGATRAQSGLLGVFGGSTLDVLADIQGQAVFEQTSIVDERVSARQNYNNQAAMYKARASNLLNSRQSPFVNAYMASFANNVSFLGSMGGTGGGGISGGAGGGGGGSTSTFDYNRGTSTSDGFA